MSKLNGFRSAVGVLGHARFRVGAAVAIVCALGTSGCLDTESIDVSGALAQGTFIGPPGQAGQVTLTQYPSPFSKQTFTTFTWTITPSTTTTTCALDGGRATTCNLTYNVSALSDGVHSLTITPSATGDAQAQPLTYVWVVKTSLPGTPTVTSTSVLGAKTSLSNGTSGTLTGTCSLDTATILVTGTDTSSAPCSGGTWAYHTANQGVDGAYAYTFQAQDAAGNLSAGTDSGTWRRDATPPLAIYNAIPTGASNSTSQTWFWSSSRDNAGGSGLASADIALFTDSLCTAPVAGQSFPNVSDFTAACGPPSANCGITAKTFLGLAEGTYYAKLTVYDQAGNSASTCRGGVTVDVTAPIASALQLNAGVAGPTGASASPVITATVTASDNLSGVAQVRLSTNPVYANTGWQPFTATTPFLLPYSSGTYTLYAWVQDAAGNLSASPASSSINLSIGAPPAVTSLKPDNSVQFTALGQSVHVEWTITSTNALAASSPVSVEYTTNDGLSSTVLSAALSNAANGGCAIVAGGTGCYDFSLPAPLVSVPFRIIVRARDVTGTVGVALGPVLNSAGLKVLAGKSSGLTGGNTLKTGLHLDGSGELAVDSKGNLYAAGLCVIYKIDVTTQVIAPYVGNRTCATAGDGAPPSASGTRVNLGARGSIAVDLSDQLYWTDSGGVRRVNAATGLVETFVGGGATTQPATGTARTSVNLNVTSLAFDTLNRLILAADDGTGASAVVLRANSDGTLEVLAGNYTGASVAGADGRTGGLGTSTGNWVKVGVRRAATDVYYILALDGVIYAFNTSTYAMSYLFNIGANHRQMAWDDARTRLIAGNATNVLEIRADIADTSNSLVAKDNGVPYGIARDAFGNLYYSTSKGQRIFRADAADAELTYAGVQPDAGDGGTALSAELRSPSQLVKASDGSIYLDDSANQRVRKITTGALMAAVGTYAAGPAPLNGGLAVPSLTAAYYAGYNAPTTVFDVQGAACKFFCGGSASTIYNAANGTSALTLAIPHATASAAFVSALAWDSMRASLFFEGFDPVSGATFVSEVDGTNNITRRIGTTVSGAPTVGGTVATTLLDALASWTPGAADHRLQANNGTIYRKGADNKVYAFPIGGNVALETPAGVTVTSYFVDFANSKIYWTVGATLYAHTLGSGNASTTIATFPYALLLGTKSFNANSLLFTYGDQVFEYTDAVNIP